MDRKKKGKILIFPEKIKKFCYNTAFIKVVIICVCISIKMPYIYDLAWANERNIYYVIGDGNNAYGYNDLLPRYRIYSKAYKSNMLDYQIQAYNGILADENYSYLNTQYLNILEKIEELEQSKQALIEYRNVLLSQETQTVTGTVITVDINHSDSTQNLLSEIDNQISNIDSQLLQYNSSLSSVVTNLSEARLSMNISVFYSNHQGMLEDEAKKMMENTFLKQCYSLIIYQEQLDYYEAYNEYLKVLRDADSIRYRYGLVTKTVLDADEVNILHNERTITENKNAYDAEIKAIKRDTRIADDTKIKLQVVFYKKSYNLEETVQNFINNNSGYQQIKNYIRSYQDQNNNFTLNSYTSFLQTEAKIEYYTLQREELENSIRTYVTQAINSYEQAIKSQEASWKELQVKSNQYDAIATKQKYKRASQLDVARSLYEKEAAELAYYQSCYDIVIWQDIIDNCIYGAMP
jgi:hypothetical protein